LRWLTLTLLVLLAAIQYPLWLGKGGWIHVYNLKRQIAEQKTLNAALDRRNEALAAEVVDLKTGYSAIEERARYELGMIKRNEKFVQIIGDPISAPPANVAEIAANSLKINKQTQ